MLALLVVVRDILLLRRGPQDLPYSPPLLIAALLASFGISVLASASAARPGEEPAASVAVMLLLYLGFVYLLLNATQREARFVQTALAWLLVDVVFTALMLPLLTLLGPVLAQAPAATDAAGPPALSGAQSAAFLLWLALGLWRLFVVAHLLRQALEIRLFFAFLINLAMVMGALVVVLALFGKSAGA
jgi:hypothetical protein